MGDKFIILTNVLSHRCAIFHQPTEEGSTDGTDRLPCFYKLPGVATVHANVSLLSALLHSNIPTFQRYDTRAPNKVRHGTATSRLRLRSCYNMDAHMDILPVFTSFGGAGNRNSTRGRQDNQTQPHAAIRVSISTREGSK